MGEARFCLLPFKRRAEADRILVVIAMGANRCAIRLMLLAVEIHGEYGEVF